MSYFLEFNHSHLFEQSIQISEYFNFTRDRCQSIRKKVKAFQIKEAEFKFKEHF